jgi:Ca2+:H+ antiporter
MLGAKAAPTLGRDTMFAVIMIVMNGLVGLGLILGTTVSEPSGVEVVKFGMMSAMVVSGMIAARYAPALGRDTMFAVIMIVMNGLVGLGLILGGLRHHRQKSGMIAARYAPAPSRL